MNKSLITNFIALLFLIISYFLLDGKLGTAIFFASLFALSGAITNWLAVHMLFEKVPFLIGSGIVPNRFRELRKALRKIILENFFSQKNFQDFKTKPLVTTKIQNAIQKLDFDQIFNNLITEIKESKLSQLLSMFGGDAMLEQFRKPFHQAIQKQTPKMTTKITEIIQNNSSYEKFRMTITSIIDQELEKLTPQKTKQIVSSIIKEHLGWLVVWGGVFGGIIGLATSVFYF